MEREKILVGGIVLCVIALSFFVYAIAGARAEQMRLAFVSKTEYVPGDIGQVIVELRYQLNSSVVPAECNASVWYPNKTAFIVDEPMAASASGSQFINFTVPSIEGTYEYQAECVYGGRQFISTNSLHVSSGFGRLQSDIRKNLQIMSQGVDQVQLGRNAKNSWKFFSPFTTTIYNATCQVNPLDQGGVMYFSDDFNRADSAIVGNDWSEQDNGVGAYTSILSNRMYTWNPNGGLTGVTWALIERNLSFVPAKVWAKVYTLGIDTNAYDMWDLAFYFHNSSGDIYGTVSLKSLYYNIYNSFQFNNCGANSPSYPDDCGNGNACTGMNVCKVYALNMSAGEQAQKNVSEDLIQLIGSAFDPYAASYVTMRYSTQDRQLSGVKFQTALDDVVVLAQPFGTEFVDNENDEFGFNWTASRDAVGTWRNLEVQCAAVFDNDGETEAQQVEQYVFISNNDRISAVMPK